MDRKFPAGAPAFDSADLRKLYIELVRDCVVGKVYDDPPMEWTGTGLRPFSSEEREGGRDWPAHAQSMVGVKRIRQLQEATETVIRENIPGDLIETGVWRGGACILMRAILKAYGVVDRTVWVADSFEGLPPPDTQRYPADSGQKLNELAPLAVPLETVRENFARYGLLDRQVRFLKGWFKDTLHKAPIARLALLRLDGDLYESTMQGLVALYGKVSPGGFVIVDDYGTFEMCRRAVDDFRAKEGISEAIQDIDGFGVFWRKPTGAAARTQARTGQAPMLDYRSYLQHLHYGRSPQHRAFEAKPAVKLDCERIAFYLPQFHRVQENDDFWGSGFTEWTNVVRATPRFSGHYQPRLPGDLGFYDLTVEDNLRRQVDIALNYGLTGFMFYCYWFGGRTVLEAPLQTFLRRKDLRLRFFLMWANENWTRRWDGKEDEVLLQQPYAPDDAEKFVTHMRAYLEDERYLRIDGRPLLAVYRALKIPQPRAWAEQVRETCARLRLGDPYLLRTLSFDEADPGEIGFDAALQFPPHQRHHMPRPRQPRRIDRLVRAYEPIQDHVFNYKDIVQSQLGIEEPGYRLFRTACPDWDNTPRRREGATVYAFSSPKRFAQWTEGLLARELARKDGFRMVCFNAWNEWAESAYLEPDALKGYANLDALYGVVARLAGK